MVAAGFLFPARGFSLCRLWGGVFLRLRILPDSSGNGGGIGGAAIDFASGMFFSCEELVEPFGVDFAAEEIRFAEDAAEEAGVGFDAGDGVFVEGAAEAGDGFFAGVAPGDEFAEKGIVFVGNGPAFVDTFVEANAGTAGGVAGKDFSWRGEEIVVRILGVEANFHGVATRRNGFPFEGETVAGRDGDLKFDEIEPGNLLGDGMLDLQTRVDFEEIEIEMRVDEKFHGAGVDVTAGARESHRGITHFFAQLGRNDGGRGFLDDFLVAALHRAFAFAEGDDAAVRVGEDLDFDMAGIFQIFFKIKARVSESIKRFGGGIAPRGGELGIASDQAHAFSAAARDGFEENGIAHGLRESLSFLWFFDGIVRARDDGNFGAASELATGSFRSEGFHGFGGRTDENEIGFFASAGEHWIFGEEAITGMNGVAVGAAGDVDEFVDAEITFAGGRGADGVGFVGEADVERGAVGFAEDGDGADAQFATGAEDADGDFTAIGD